MVLVEAPPWRGPRPRPGDSASDFALLGCSDYGLMSFTHHLLCWFELKGSGHQDQTLRSSATVALGATRN